jgi:pyrimidine deaminase RibD-like protein
MIGFLVGSIAVVLANQTLIVVGVVIVGLGLVVGKVMQMMASDPHAEPAREKTGPSAAG